MKYVGPKFYEAHIRGDIALLRGRLSAILGRAVPEPRMVRVSEIRSGAKRGGAWAAKMGGQWGVSFADNDDVWMVTGPRGERNKAWRKDFFHENAHVVLFAAGISNAGDAHHKQWFRKLRVPV